MDLNFFPENNFPLHVEEQREGAGENTPMGKKSLSKHLTKKFCSRKSIRTWKTFTDE